MPKEKQVTAETPASETPASETPAAKTSSPVTPTAPAPSTVAPNASFHHPQTQRRGILPKLSCCTSSMYRCQPGVIGL